MSLVAENGHTMHPEAINSSNGVKVCKFNIVSDQWLDPSTFRVMFTIHNQNPVSPPIKVKTTPLESSCSVPSLSRYLWRCGYRRY